MPKRKDSGAFVGFVGLPAAASRRHVPEHAGWAGLGIAACSAAWLLQFEKPELWFGFAALAVVCDAVFRTRASTDPGTGDWGGSSIPMRSPFVVLAALHVGLAPTLVLEAALAAMRARSVRQPLRVRLRSLVCEGVPRFAGLILAAAAAAQVSAVAGGVGWLAEAAAVAVYVGTNLIGRLVRPVRLTELLHGAGPDSVVLVGTSWAAFVFVSAESPVLMGLCLFPILALGALKETDRLFADHHFGTVAGLSLMLQRAHPHTHRHLARVADMAERVARRLGMSPDHARKVREASILHDIGKIAVDEAILDKPGPLTAQEYEHVKTHAEYGAKILEPVAEFKELARWIRWHHERLDGKGYPDGLEGSDIPVESRIIAVVDAFDAMTSGLDGGEARPYRKPIPVREALAELRRCSGTQFDPRVVDAFEEAILETAS